MKPSITVIITTRDRSTMLVDALESVRRQTALGSVARVIVSENGETGDSKEVCERFGDLPLLYVRQQPPVPSLFHLKALWQHVESPLVSILHDDDWWMPEHLENSLAVLTERPDCGVTFSNFFDTAGGPTNIPWSTSKALQVWVSSGCDFGPKLLILDQISILLACLLHSTFHYSTLVGRKDVVWEAYLKIASLDNVWDNERTFPVFLSAWGPVGFLTKHAACIRYHPAQEGQDLKVAVAGFGETRVRTTLWLAAKNPESTALAVKKFNETVDNLRPDLYGQVSNQIDEPQKTALIEKLGFKLIPTPPKDTRWLIKQLIPPAVLELQRHSRQLLKKR